MNILPPDGEALSQFAGRCAISAALAEVLAPLAFGRCQ